MKYYIYTIIYQCYTTYDVCIVLTNKLYDIS